MSKSHCDVELCVFRCGAADGAIAANSGARASCVATAIAHKVRFGVGEYLAREGLARTHFYVVCVGYVKLASVHPSGRTQMTGLRGPGQFVGFAWDDTVYPYTATALARVEACQIPHKAVLQVLRKDSAVALRVVGQIAKELAEARTLIRGIGGRNAHQRVASFLLSLYRPEVKVRTTLPLPLGRQEMAELLGLSRETVSRVISDLSDDGLIAVSRDGVSILCAAELTVCAFGARIRAKTAIT